MTKQEIMIKGPKRSSCRKQRERSGRFTNHANDRIEISERLDEKDVRKPKVGVVKQCDWNKWR